MKSKDIQLGKPEQPFSDTATNLESFTTEGMVGYATDTHKFGFYNGTSWVYPVAGFLFTGGGVSQELALPNAKITLSGGGASAELAMPNAKVALSGGGASCTLTLPNAGTSITGGGTIALGTYTLTVAGTASVKGTFAGNTYTLTVNQNLTLGGASGKTLTLTNSLTNQGGNDGILSWSGAFTLTIPATGSAALLGTANIFTAAQTSSISDSATNTITTVHNFTHNSSSGSVAATFGVRIYDNLKSTTTADTNAFTRVTQWVVATHASRTARTTWSTIDFGGTREVIRIEGSGTAGLLSFFGVTAVVRATAYTQTYSTASKTAAALTYTSPGAYAGGANGYSTTTQAQAVITALGQLNADTIAIYKVVTQIIDDLQAYGLFQ
jgi:hypothetical protein